MTQKPIIIFAGDNGWRLSHGDSTHDIASSISTPPVQIAAEIATIIGSLAEEATLVIPSTWCLSATVSLAGVPVRSRRTALLYRLELLLPLTAEEVVADYILNEPSSALAVCIPVAMVKPYIDAIEAEGILIHTLVPASPFAASSLSASQSAINLVVWQSAQSIELFTAEQGKITGWFIFPATANDLQWHLDQLTGKRSNWNAIACNIDPILLDQLKKIGSLKLTSIDGRSVEQVVSAAITAGERAPVNLRQDRLSPSSPFRAIRRPLNEAIMAALLLVVCVCGAACWRAARLEQFVSFNRDEQRKLFLQLFPGHVVPANIVSRLKSEDRSLGSANATGSKQSSHPTLLVLQSILAGIDSLPPQSRLQVDELKVDNATFSLDGAVKSRADLTNVVDVLQQTMRIKLDPPQTEQAAGKGLHITLNGIAVDNLLPK